MAGPDAPDPAEQPQPQAPPPTDQQQQYAGQPQGGGRTGVGALGIGGWILAALGALILIAGVAAIVLHASQRDDGYFVSDTKRVADKGFAVTARGFNLSGDEATDIVQALVGRIRVRAESPRGDGVFIGIARTRDLDRYLSGVRHSEVSEFADGRVDYRRFPGDAPDGAPEDQNFWRAQVDGSGTQDLTWKVEEGKWSVAVMNPGGGAPVAADVSVAAKTNALLWVGIGLAVIGLLMVGGGWLMIAADLRSRRRNAAFG